MEWIVKSTGKKYVLPFGEKTFVMGIINTSPDSFSGDGLNSSEDAFRQAERFIKEGVDILDVGGQSTRPGSGKVEISVEIERTAELIKKLSSEFDVPVSIDTYKSPVAEAALAAGAAMINDISGGMFDSAMAPLAAAAGLPVILMHIKGKPDTMQKGEIIYDDVVGSVKEYLSECVNRALSAGVEKDRIIIDPGIGFGKTVSHNLIILRRLRELKETGFPLLAGVSRKSFIGKILGLPENDRLEGTAAAVTAAILNGADIIRVHDVKAMKRVAVIADAIRGG
ncbi:MAG: dihydropteroate synthase [Elusimicrobiota bacterium]|nr:dihydropteroate synthase [Elusimicrobiota bacterium]